eukprot:CAMPEP_0197560988 /NCGR_PEP_ID=MMETSP1320-20131121/24284_1 /TAXON_ID=91990 /ORGANISM="Bolidomonas sp., Strain RCC2347" /LENGTH=117 /DNA_ID=CAMNT_0043122585 /DNA_START=172 /DNA_END=521 /DNA_ORIENTATION=-
MNVKPVLPVLQPLPPPPSLPPNTSVRSLPLPQALSFVNDVLSNRFDYDAHLRSYKEACSLASPPAKKKSRSSPLAASPSAKAVATTIYHDTFRRVCVRPHVAASTASDLNAFHGLQL